MVTPSIKRDKAPHHHTQVELSWKAFEELPLWKQASHEQRKCALTQAGSTATPARVLAALEQVLRTRPELAETVRRGTQQQDQLSDQRPSPRQPLRRARLTADGHAVTVTPMGLIVDGLEIEYTPTFDEASREIGARQRQYMLGGVEPHEALAMALAEVHPVYKRAYTA